ncbi:MAG: UvrD-helicase domain-containing protein [Bacteroidales bacterium]|nr:UvrD-helicase domain-containing protein [Bacteroidales bacterium]
MIDKILSGLNKAQIDGVQTVEGPVMVIAGAGSGKTRVLTCRVAWLMAHHQVNPFQILALTFTNKAAREMQERIRNILGNDARNVWMGTFHSIFAKILRFEAEHLGYTKSFSIYDTDECKSLIKNIIKEMNLDTDAYKPALVLNRISMAKNNLYSYEQYLSSGTFQSQDVADKKPFIGELYKAYQMRLRRYDAMDFDDLLFNMNILLRDFPDVLEKYQRLFKYILVDEYQDTNFSQYVIIKKLAAQHRNICVVGDDSQSIYAFRGANIQNILKFKKDYPETVTIKLEQNYRSSKVIVEASNRIIENNEGRIPKKIWTDNTQGNLIKVIQADSDREEGVLVANDIFEQKMNNQLMNSDFVILYRTNAQSRALEEALRHRNIPYKVVSGMSFYARKEIKDVLAYFKVVMNPRDEESLLRIINYPARGIGDTTLGKLRTVALAHNTALWNVCQSPESFETSLPESMTKKVKQFCGMMTNFAERLHTSDAFTLAHSIVSASGILTEFQKENTPESISRKENVEELLNAIQAFATGQLDAPGSAPGGEHDPEKNQQLRTLNAFMQDIALVSDVDEKDDNPNKVSLMTIHAAKGLEFPFVYVTGLEENLFPNTQMIASQADLEEERRLFYVAVTRAERNLTLSYAQLRFRWGELMMCEPSRFLDEIDESLVSQIPKKMSIPANLKQSSEFRVPSSEFRVSSSKFQTSKPETRNPNLKKVSNLSSSSSKPSAAAQNLNLIPGMRVEHQKFGIGTVISVEGVGDNAKAHVDFDNAGQRMLMLRFAILTVVD